MLAITFRAPEGHSRGPTILVIVLERENLDRMRLADPLDIKLNGLPGLRTTPAIAIDLVIASEDEISMNELLGFHTKGDVPGLMAYLERGRQILPGDLKAPRRL